MTGLPRQKSEKSIEGTREPSPCAFVKKLLSLTFTIKDRKAPLLFLFSVLIITLLVWLSLLPYKHLSINALDVTQITIICGNDETVINDYTDIENVVGKINKICLYPSDLNALPSSPEKFINISLNNGKVIEINNVGIYSLITCSQKENDTYKIISGDIFLTHFFIINNISLYANTE